MDFLPQELENIIIDYKEQLEAFEKIEEANISFKQSYHRETTEITYNQLYYSLIDEEIKHCNEIINTDFIKPYVDYEYNGDKNIDDVINELTEVLCEIFKVENEEWAISSCERNGRITLHYVLWTKKTRKQQLYDIINSNQDELNEIGGGVDIFSYRECNIFRIPMTYKMTYGGNVNEETYLYPENYTTYEEFYRHFVTITEECEEL